MKRILVLDLPALLQGNQCGVNVPLLHETLRDALTLKNIKLMLCKEDVALLASNTDYAFTENVWKFLSDIDVVPYDGTDRKDGVTFAPDIIGNTFSVEMQKAIYLL